MEDSTPAGCSEDLAQRHGHAGRGLAPSGSPDRTRPWSPGFNLPDGMSATRSTGLTLQRRARLKLWSRPARIGRDTTPEASVPPEPPFPPPLPEAVPLPVVSENPIFSETRDLRKEAEVYFPSASGFLPPAQRGAAACSRGT